MGDEPDQTQEQKGSVRAGFVITGTEVLAGRVRDRNGPWLADRLAELGIELAHVLITGDRPADLLSALEFMRAEGADLIVTSGGLGPTADDLTAQVVADFAQRPLRLDEDLERRIGEIIARFARRWKLDPKALEFWRTASRAKPRARSRSTRSARLRAGRACRRADRGRAARPAAGLQGSWARRSRRSRSPRVVRRCRATASHGADVRDPRVGARRDAAGRRRDRGVRPASYTTCLRRGEAQDRDPPESRATAGGGS